MPLRDVPVGAKFMLCRTGKKYKRIGEDANRIMVKPVGWLPRLKSSYPMSLNHQCVVDVNGVANG